MGDKKNEYIKAIMTDRALFNQTTQPKNVAQLFVRIQYTCISKVL